MVLLDNLEKQMMNLTGKTNFTNEKNGRIWSPFYSWAQLSEDEAEWAQLLTNWVFSISKL